MPIHDKVLISLRQIIRAIDLHSKEIDRQSGLTGPQLLVMKIIKQHGEIHAGVLAKQINLSQATVTTILDRLEKKQFVLRTRSSIDKRVVIVTLTDAGESALLHAPELLQESFIQAFSNLPEWEQSLILSSLQRVATMMNADNLDAAPLIDSSDAQVVNEE